MHEGRLAEFDAATTSEHGSSTPASDGNDAADDARAVDAIDAERTDQSTSRPADVAAQHGGHDPRPLMGPLALVAIVAFFGALYGDRS